MRLHIAPSRGWLNDPNGLTRRDGRWHVFYQHNPHAPVHSNVHWGHQSSPDLANWTEHPVAFGPRPGQADAIGAWSGVVTMHHEPVTRPDGSTQESFGTAAYTGVHDTAQNSTVCLRQALDPELLTWTDPEVVAHTPAEVGEMRDPYFFRHEGRRYALLGAGLPDKRPALLLFECDDLHDWHYLGVWLTPDTPGLEGSFAEALGPAQIWECPQLAQVDGRWVLIVSLWFDHVLGDIAYLLLDLVSDSDGHPVPVPRAAGRVDLGNAAYAPQVLPIEDPAESPLMLAWVRHEGLPDDPDGVAGCLSLPTRLSLDDDLLVVSPDPAATTLLGTAVQHDLMAGQELDLPRAARVLPGGDCVLIGTDSGGIDRDAADRAANHPDRSDRTDPGEVTERPVPATAQLWVDDDVAEIFGHGPSTTLRCAGGGWRLRALEPQRVELAEAKA